jgi:hypothetical protein
MICGLPLYDHQPEAIMHKADQLKAQQDRTRGRGLDSRYLVVRVLLDPDGVCRARTSPLLFFCT